MPKVKKIRRRPWTPEEDKALKRHSRDRTPVAKIAKEFKRTPLALRLRAMEKGFPLGHVR